MNEWWATAPVIVTGIVSLLVVVLQRRKDAADRAAVRADTAQKLIAASGQVLDDAMEQGAAQEKRQQTEIDRLASENARLQTVITDQRSALTECNKLVAEYQVLERLR